MLVSRANKQLIRNLQKIRCYSKALLNEDEYTATPQYPPIFDLSYEKKLERKKEAVYEEIKNVKTIEEKQIKLNMPKYYGFKCYGVTDEIVPFNNLTLTQHITRTHLIESQNLPEYYNTIDVSTIDLEGLKHAIKKAVAFELDGYRSIHDIRKEELETDVRENLISTAISKQINRIITNHLATKYTYLHNVEVDQDPRIESFWYAGGMNPPENIKRYRRGQEWQKNRVDEPTNRLINYMGTANLALRSDKPLPPFIPYSESENPALEVPFWQYDPRTVGLSTSHKHIANVPGFWPGDPNRFGFLSVHRRGCLVNRQYNDPVDDKEAVHRLGILGSFAWLNAQANFLGFNTFNDITYPLATQTVITNGQLWSFYCYQLNTLQFHSKYVNENKKRNVCWATPELKLYERLNEKGELDGFNDEILNVLVKFYANEPKVRADVDNLTPYLGKDEKLIADYADEEKREWLEREYKFLVANRPRYKLEYEVYNWEKIYKIDHKTRFIDAKRRPFELKIKPWDRTLDDRQPRYIPRAHRPDLPRYKGRYAKEYFP